MGCCEYKNLGRKYSEVGELSRADSFSKVSEKYNGHDSTYFIEPNKEPSSLSIKLQKIPLETKNYEQINGNKYNENFDFNNKKELPPLIPLNAIENSLIKSVKMERLKMLSPSRRLQGKYNNNFNSNFNGFSLADQSPSCKVFPFISNKKDALNSNIFNSNLHGTRFSLQDESPSAKLFPFLFQPSDLVTLKLNSIYEDYFIGAILGEGGFSKVFEVIDKHTQNKRALKCIRKLNQKDFSDKVLKEVRILKSLDHPNMVRIFDFYETPDEFQIVTELCTGGELFYKISECQQFDESMACNIMRQILSCLEYCHRNHIAHLDIKPENLIFESNEPGALLKLIDFGTSTIYNPEEKMTIKIGTPAYMAPEVFKNNYNEKCDVWSCGVILYVMLSGMLPFGGDTEDEIRDAVLNNDVSFADEEWLFISGEAKAFLRRLLEKNPLVRYSAAQALMDPWMLRFGQKTFVQVSSTNMQKTLENLRNYKNTKQFQKVVWTVIAQYLVTKNEQEEVLKIFRSLDLNEDGQLSREELIQGYEKIFGNRERAVMEVERIMKNVDQNKNNFIDYSEFLMATINKEDYLTSEKLETVFNIIDKEKSGRISFESVKKLFQECDKNVPSEFWKKLLEEFSRYENGYLDLANFKIFMKQNIRKISASN